MAKKSFAAQVKGADKLFSVNDAPHSAPTEPIMQMLKINPVFKALIPPLSSEEYMHLEQNLIKDGIREAISVWGEIIIDGHNRYEIAQKNGLSYSIISYKFENESDVIVWIINNQFGRRNLTAYDRCVLALRLKPVISEKAKEQQLRRSAGSVSQNSVKQTPIDTQRELAEIAGVSHDTISKVEKIEQAATPEVISQLKRGDISINKAYQDIKKQKKRDESSSFTEQLIPVNTLNDKYDVIYCNCPWESELSDSEKRNDSNLYHTMLFKDIVTLSIPAEDNAIIFMWATAPILIKALQVMAKWGFVYRTCTVWDKQIADTGQWIYGQHELLLIGIKGKYTTPTIDTKISSVYRETRRNNFDKPEFYYSMIEQMCPGGKYLEIFAQKKYSSEWDVLINPMSKEENEE